MQLVLNLHRRTTGIAVPPGVEQPYHWCQWFVQVPFLCGAHWSLYTFTSGATVQRIICLLCVTTCTGQHWLLKCPQCMCTLHVALAPLMALNCKFMTLVYCSHVGLGVALVLSPSLVGFGSNCTCCSSPLLWQQQPMWQFPHCGSSPPLYSCPYLAVVSHVAVPLKCASSPTLTTSPNVTVVPRVLLPKILVLHVVVPQL